MKFVLDGFYSIICTLDDKVTYLIGLIVVKMYTDTDFLTNISYIITLAIIAVYLKTMRKTLKKELLELDIIKDDE